MEYLSIGKGWTLVLKKNRRMALTCVSLLVLSGQGCVQDSGKPAAGSGSTTFGARPAPTPSAPAQVSASPKLTIGAIAASQVAGLAGVRTVLRQSDGKLLVSCDSSAGSTLMRFNSDSTPDQTFMTNIGVGPNGTVDSLIQQADGRILIGGDFTQFNTTTVGRIVRLNPDGTLDQNFVSQAGRGFDNTVSSFALNANGNILVGGNFGDFNGVALTRIARLLPSGLLDTQFGQPPATPVTVLGYVDGFGTVGAGVVNGWSCAQGVSDPISVDVFAGAPSAGHKIGTGTANMTNEQAVNDACGASGNHRYQIAIASDKIAQYSGQSIYVNGFAAGGQAILNQSGNFTLQGPRVLGYVDGFGAAGPKIVNGWSCVSGLSDSINVDVFAGQPSSGNKIGTGVANITNEQAVNDACGATGNHRYQITIADDKIAQYSGQAIFVNGYTANANGALTQSGNFTLQGPAPARILGYVDAIGAVGPNVVNGWSCASGIANSINVDLYAGSPSSGHKIGTGSANISNEQAVNDACGAAGSHRYQITISDDMVAQYSGQAIFANGYTTNGQGVLNQSGNFTVPAPARVPAGSSKPQKPGDT